jgi:GT2 family glycosyltransferase
MELPALEPRLERPALVEKPAWLQSPFEAAPIDVSVCIVNWNSCDLLRGCLDSLQNQPQGVRIETIVVDNASTDGAPEMVRREFPEVLLIRNSANVGFSRANNQAARRALGRYLFFLNNDTVVPAGTIGRLVDYLEGHPAVGILGPRLRDGLGRTQVSYRELPTVAAFLHRTYLLRWTGLFRRSYRRFRSCRRRAFDPTETMPVPVLMGAAMLMPRTAFDEIGGWDEGYVFGGEDIDLCARVGRCRPIVYLPEVEITHYGRESARRNVAFSEPNIAIGFVRALRQCGAGRLSLIGYKLAVTLDAPVQIALRGLEYGWRRLRGRPDSARKRWQLANGAWHFLRRGLSRFWKA